MTEARAAAKNMGKAFLVARRFDAGLHGSAASSDFAKIVRDSESSVMMEPDPKAWYHEGFLTARGQSDSALRLSKAAVKQNYCAYSALTSDPLLAKSPRQSRIQPVANGSEGLSERGRGDTKLAVDNAEVA